MHKIITQIAGLSLLALFLLAAGPARAEVVVQVMSVQDEAAAKKEADRLFDLGVPAFSRTEEVAERGLWTRVYLGPFETESDASIAAEILKKQGTIKDYLIKTISVPAAPEGGLQTTPDGLPAAGHVPDESVGVEAGDGTLLPRAQTPTYGEPVSPEQARELGLPMPAQPRTYGETGESAGPVDGLTTYGQGENRAAPAEGQIPGGLTPGQSSPELVLPEADESGLPPGFKPGDDMPGLALPPADESGLPPGFQPGADMPGLVLPPGPVPGEDMPGLTPPSAAPDSTTTTAPGTGASWSAPVPAPSAGDDSGGPIVVAQSIPNPDGSGYIIPAKPTAPQKLAGFTALVDLSSSMRRMSNCDHRIKEEAVGALMRKMNHRIPSHPYTTSLRVFGYKIAVTRKDFTTLYYGPAIYNRDEFEDAVARLIAADSVSPFAAAINAADGELQGMGNPKAVLMFADFEESIGSGTPVQSASNARRRYGPELSIYTFYVTRQTSGASLAKDIANAGGGKAYDICRMLSDDIAFENMMMEIFGPSDTPPCADQDGDGVCDEDDLCPNTPKGAPVDERGCWIAAYSQFFDFDKAVVKSAFLPRIQHAAEIMVRNPQLPKVIIAGHTDNVGTPQYNMELGHRRAVAVYDLMLKYGVPASRMEVISYGEERPITTNETEEGRARNRRVEFHIGDVPPHRARP